jgi:hypothetical protein
MPQTAVALKPPSNEIYSHGRLVGLTDRVYAVRPPTVTFDDVVVKGDLSGELEYNGQKLRITRIDTIIGLESGMHGVRGPVWKGVECQVVGNA